MLIVTTSNMQAYKNKAFSMLELAIVIVVIGLLTIGISTGQRLINKGRLSKARMLTNSAPVAGIEGLALWLEPTYLDSITKDENGLVSTWHDLSPYGNDFTQTIETSRPTLKYYGMNDYAGLSFDGGDRFTKHIKTYNSPSTIFMVFNANPNSSNSFLFAGVPNSIPETNGGYQIFISPRGSLLFNYTDNSGVGNNFTFSSVKYGKSNTISVVMDGVDNVKGYYNGTLKFNGTISGGFSSKYEFYGIGRNRANANFFDGYIAEVILYKSALSDTERQEVENYLAEKYNITLGS